MPASHLAHQFFPMLAEPLAVLLVHSVLNDPQEEVRAAQVRAALPEAADDAAG